MKIPHFSTLLVASIAFSLATARAEIIALWELDELGGVESTAIADETAPGVTVSELKQGIGPTAGWPKALGALQNSATITSLPNAIAEEEYFSFTVTVKDGYSAGISDLFLRYSVGANVRPAETTFTLMCSLTGFGEADALGTLAASLPADVSKVGTGTFDLTQSRPLQKIAPGTPVEFRIYVHNTGEKPMTRIAVGHLSFANTSEDLVLNGNISAAK